MSALPGGDCRITRLVVSAGVLSGVQEECLSMYLEALGKGTVAEGAVLELKFSPAWLVCCQCGHRREHDPKGPVELDCEKCGGPNTLEGGRDEIILESLEVQKEDN